MRASLDAGEAPRVGGHARLEQIGGRDWVSAARRPVFDGGGAADEQSIRALKSALTGRAVNRNNYW